MKRMVGVLSTFLCVSGLLIACSVKAPLKPSTNFGTKPNETEPISSYMPPGVSEDNTQPGLPIETTSTISNQETDVSETTGHTTNPDDQNLITSHPTIAPSSLPQYQPGTILLEDQNYDDYDFERKYRITYYRIWGEFLNLITEEQVQDFYVWADETHKQTGYGATQNTMFLADFVKRYHISRTDFDQAVKEFSINSKLNQYDIIPEEYEPPNADIIYTFDDEIINEYYRYE